MKPVRPKKKRSAGAKGDLHMVDVGGKAVSLRAAVATARIRLSEGARRAVLEGALPKGDALAAARVAGVLAAKRVSELVPLCHNIPLDSVDVEIRAIQSGLEVSARAQAHGRTGVEMEAMTAAAVAALTVYDMVKGVDRSAEIERVRLEEKSGGRSGDYRRSKAEERPTR